MRLGDFKSITYQINKLKNNSIVFKVLLALLLLFIGLSLITPSYSQGFIETASLPLQTFKSLTGPSKNVLKYLINEKQIQEKYPIIHVKENHSSNLDFIDFDRKNIKYIYPEVIDTIYNSTDLDSVDWSKYAYVLYATSTNHMCNAMMICSELRKYKTRAQLLILVKKEFLSKPEEFEYEYKTLTTFAKEYNVTLKATQVIQRGGDDVNIWLSSYTKLMVFNETDYDRIIYMDSDALLTRDNLDELFFVPPCKMAVSTAYWNAKENYEREGVEHLANTYEKHKPFVPLTTRQRTKKVRNFIQENIEPYYEKKNKKDVLPFIKSKHQISNKKKSEQSIEASSINERNFYTNLYNELPNYVALDEFVLTNIIMVITPSPELFNLVLKAIDEKKKGEYDMELVQYHLFDIRNIGSKQLLNSIENDPELSYHERLEEIPEFLILPHQIYGTLTQEINVNEHHSSYYADAYEQVFAHLGRKTSNHEDPYYFIDDIPNVHDFYFKNVKYLHFSDAPIPKPWYYQNPKAGYMSNRYRCPSHKDFTNDEVTKPGHTTRDCSGGKIWEKAHAIFKKTRKDICGLDLVVTEEDTYYKLIN